jgi:hypothetical protein
MTTPRPEIPPIPEHLREKFEALPSIGHYDRNGEPIDFWTYCQLFENRNYRVLASKRIGHVYVSTVWLGLDHSWRGGMLIFETMVFGGRRNGYQERYATEEEARLGQFLTEAHVACDMQEYTRRKRDRIRRAFNVFRRASSEPWLGRERPGFNGRFMQKDDRELLRYAAKVRRAKRG